MTGWPVSEPASARQIVVLTLGEEQYAFPIERVHEVIRYRQPRTITSSDRSVPGVISLRGRTLVVHDLAARLGIGGGPDEHSKIVIVRTAEETIGVIVDDVQEVLTVADDRIEQVAGGEQGATDLIVKLHDRLLVLLDPASLFARPADALDGDPMIDAAQA